MVSTYFETPGFDGRVMTPLSVIPHSVLLIVLINVGPTSFNDPTETVVVDWYSSPCRVDDDGLNPSHWFEVREMTSV